MLPSAVFVTRHAAALYGGFIHQCYQEVLKRCRKAMEAIRPAFPGRRNCGGCRRPSAGTVVVLRQGGSSFSICCTGRWTRAASESLSTAAGISKTRKNGGTLIAPTPIRFPTKPNRISTSCACSGTRVWMTAACAHMHWKCNMPGICYRGCFVRGVSRLLPIFPHCCPASRGRGIWAGA